MTAVAPRPSALSILRRSSPGDEEDGAEPGGREAHPPAENTSDFSCRANLRRSGRAHDRGRLVSRRSAVSPWPPVPMRRSASRPLAPLIREEFSLTRWQVGAITAIVFGGAAISSVSLGHLTDRFGAPPVLAAAVAARRLWLPAGRDRARRRALLPARRGRGRAVLRTDHAAHERDRARSADDAASQPAHEHQAGRRDDWRLRLGRHDADDRPPRRLATRAARPGGGLSAVALSALLSRRTLARNAGDAI